ncbi:hypothetical protein C1637_04945 [Chryseobacterium lactis]|uniref:Uncharacterized protein n=1 Tax=Chryseobacterium lactis TaxID=1241981 RepID=A0A3G6RZ88_CHRLC|nr:hypothetical protein EG342_08335 [Chryseobacterium lactis]AZB06920.1 hypothetical protein EG341_24450 [Chryseobacterium lactis]PNW15772.1 hypothetical protein C1637_04945 [Chryseobacterium lactis]
MAYLPLPITHYPLPITHYPLPITHNRKLPRPSFSLPLSNALTLPPDPSNICLKFFFLPTSTLPLNITEK